MFKVNNRSFTNRCEICSKFKLKTSEWDHWRCGNIDKGISECISVLVIEIKEKARCRSFIKRQTNGTASDNKWQRVVQRVTMTKSGKTNDNEWRWVTTIGTTSDNEWQRVVQRLIAKVSRPFQTYINHRVSFHHFLRRFPQIYLSKVTER